MEDKKKDPDMETHAIAMKKLLETKFKRSLWDRFKDTVGVFFMGIATLISAVFIVGIIVFLIVTFIENPLSLAIICGTLLLMWMWGNR